jgi:predicted O-methyltransferase YrrM
MYDDVMGCCYPNTMALMNFLVTNCLENDEIYLELGSFCGRTLIAALTDNEAQAISIDPLIHDDSATAIFDNVARYNVADRVTIHHKYWQDFIKEGQAAPPVGIFFDDGDHGTGSTIQSLEAFVPFLADESIIVIDDMEMEPVRLEVDQWFHENQDHIAFYREARYFMGQAVIGFARNL